MRVDEPYRFMLGILFIAISVAACWIPIHYVWPFAGKISSFIFGIIWALMGIRAIIISISKK